MLDFTPAELDAVARVLLDYLRRDTFSTPQEKDALLSACDKLTLEGLIGRKSQFVYRGRTLYGTIKEVRTVDGVDRIVMDCDASVYTIPLHALISPAA